MNYPRILLISAAIFALIIPGIQAQQEVRYSHARVARNVIKKFKGIKTYTAGFRIQTKDGRRIRNMRGSFYYQKPGKVRFSFSQPSGNLIVSDGKTMWVYIRRLNAVGKQDLTLKKKNESGRPIFVGTPGPGLARLFRKYHYRFDSPEQPRVVDGAKVFVLDMEQREKIGGYENIKLFIDASSYLVRKAVASDGYGKTTTMTFIKPALDRQLDGTRFQYKPGRGVRVVNNPLVNE